VSMGGGWRLIFLVISFISLTVLATVVSQVIDAKPVISGCGAAEGGEASTGRDDARE